MRKRFSLILATTLLCVGNLVAQISSLPVPIGETKWRTLMAPVTLEIPDGITAYTVPSVSDGYVNLVEIAGEFIPANVPVLLQADAAGDYEFLIASGEFEVGDNLLEGTIAKKYVSMSPDYNYYVFDEGECVWLPAVSIEEMEDCFSAEAYTAYLQVPTTMAESYSSLSIATVTASGSCGENLTWMLTAEGELIIEGTGEITSIPWRDFKGTITKVTLSAGVTGTVSYAFEGCSSLTTVNIPENSQLINIETAMFQNCSSLASITIPMSVTSIGYYAFDGCSSLASITIPKSVAEIANYAFRNCGGLTSITIKSTTPPTIGRYSFVGVDMFVYVPTGSVAAYKEAEHWSEFANIQAIVSLVSSGTCGDNLTWELTDDGKLTIEGTGAMYGYGWSASPWFSHREFITEVVIPEGVTNIGEGIFWDCTGLAEITIPAGVTSIDNYAFSGCRNLVAVSVPESVKSIGVYAFQNCNSLTAITIPEGVMSIGNNTFENCNSLIAITIPEGVMNIGSNAFFGCSGLTSIACNTTTPPAIEDQWSLYGVDKSIPVYVPASAVAAYKEADYWKEFTNIQAPIIDSGTCGENLTWKINGAYELTIEGMGAMYDYSNNSAAPWQNYKGSIKSIDIKDGVTSVGSWAFSQCPILTDVSIAESVTSIGGDAFRECSILEEITLPKGLTELGTGVFLYCSALKSITVPEGVTKIGSDTFEFCPQLSSITFPSSLTEIGPWALKGAYNLASITCKAATPPSLGNEAFSGVSYDITVYVPASSVEAYKTAEGWNQFANIQPIILGSGTCGDDLAWKLTDEGELTIEGTGAMTSAPWRDYTESIKVITIKEGVTTICDRAFEGCNQVETMIIPKGVNEIGMDAFWNCTGVLYLNSMPVTGDYMMGGAFSGSRFTKVVISDDITDIKDMAFFYMTSLTEVVLPENLQRIGEMAFSGCRSITTITIPESVTTIGNYAFEMCEGLTSITCRTATPPSCGYEVFYAVGKSIPLYVSLDAIDEYQSAEQWKDFDYIVGTAMCGETLTGQLWPDGKLIVKGEGAITTAPWEAYGEQVKELVLEEGVTGIADKSFVGFDNLLSITSYAENPPVCSAEAFNGVEKTTPVYVVPSKLEDYSVSEGWCEFIYLTSNDSRILLDSYVDYSHEEDESFEEIAYVRTFNNTNWQALYVPFEIPVTEEFLSDFEVADLNDIRQYDRDDDGVKDETAVEAFKVTSGTLKANYPYLIRAKEAGEKTIIVADATLYATKENSYDCSSLHEKYTFTPTYSRIEGFALAGCYALSGGVWQPIDEEEALGAFRFYLMIESRDGNLQVARTIRLRIIGGANDDDTTRIDTAESTANGRQSAVVYDLQGRRVVNPTKGIYIVNGKKLMY